MKHSGKETQRSTATGRNLFKLHLPISQPLVNIIITVLTLCRTTGMQTSHVIQNLNKRSDRSVASITVFLGHQITSQTCCAKLCLFNAQDMTLPQNKHGTALGQKQSFWLIVTGANVVCSVKVFDKNQHLHNTQAYATRDGHQIMDDESITCHQ